MSNPGEYARHARDRPKRRLEERRGPQYRREVTELSLYRLAKDMSPRDGRQAGCVPGGELAFLDASVKQHDTWGTFMALSQAWRNNYGQGGNPNCLEMYLPRILELDEFDGSSLVETGFEDRENPDRISERIEKNVETALGELRPDPTGADLLVASILGRFGGKVLTTQHRIDETQEAVMRIEASSRKAQTLLWVIVLGLGLLLLVQWLP